MFSVDTANGGGGSNGTENQSQVGLPVGSSQGGRSQMANTANQAEINEKVKKEKLLALKARLTQKRADARADAIQSPASPSSFSKFIAKVDT